MRFPGAARSGRIARLVLDAPPSAIHAGIYLAQARGFTEAEGVDLRVEAPDTPSSGLRLLEAGRAQFAVLDLHDLALAREGGHDLVAVLALTQRPRATVLAGPRVASARALAGARVGVTGRLSDAAVLRAIVRATGGRAGSPRRVRTGFGGVRALERGRVAAITALGTGAATAVRARVPRSHAFGVEDAGAPAYPELVLVTRRETIQDTPALVQATVTALRRGYREVLLGPEEAVGALVDRADGLDRRTVQADMDAVLPDLDAGGHGFGALDLPTLQRWATWERHAGITRRRPARRAPVRDPGHDLRLSEPPGERLAGPATGCGCAGTPGALTRAGSACTASRSGRRGPDGRRPPRRCRRRRAA